MKSGIVALVILLVLVGCSPAIVPASSPAPSVAPVAETPIPATPPARAVTTPPPGAGTVSSELIGGTTDCTVKADCVSYKEKDGTPAELCAYYDDVGCYHHYACNPYGEVAQKETPAFCGR